MRLKDTVKVREILEMTRHCSKEELTENSFDSLEQTALRSWIPGTVPLYVLMGSKY